MALSLAEELRRTFDRAALKREADDLRSPVQWRRARALQDRCERIVQKEEKSFRQNYDTRVEVALRRILSRAGAKTKNFQPPWSNRDRFSPDDALRQAQREVRSAHHNRIEKIHAFEARELRSIVKQATRENTMRGTLRQDFKRVTNRRFGHDRRRGPSR